MCGNSDYALGMPSGSVRGIITLILIPLLNISAIVLMFFFFFRNQYESALGILAGLTGINGSIIGYYFGSKSADKSTKEIVNANEKLNQANRDMIETQKLVHEEQRHTNEVQKNIIVHKDREIEHLNKNVLLNNMV